MPGGYGGGGYTAGYGDVRGTARTSLLSNLDGDGPAQAMLHNAPLLTRWLSRLAPRLSCSAKLLLLLLGVLGAYVAAVYASDPANESKIDRMMLLAPTFKPSACLATVEKEMGVSLGDAFRDDLKNHPDFPFAPCRAYVVHGYDDEASPLENSLTWVRDASVNLRARPRASPTAARSSRPRLEVRWRRTSGALWMRSWRRR